jgi:hypothetical protein
VEGSRVEEEEGEGEGVVCADVCVGLPPSQSTGGCEAAYEKSLAGSREALKDFW